MNNLEKREIAESKVAELVSKIIALLLGSERPGTELSALASEAIEGIYDALNHYVEERDRCDNKLVGQFLDAAGISDSQHGVYGMAGWLTLAKSAPTAPAKCAALSKACADHLTRLITTATDPKTKLSNLKKLKDDGAYEIRRLTAKAAAVLEAAADSTLFQGAALDKLREHVMAAKRNDGLWAYVLKGPSDNTASRAHVSNSAMLEATTLVIRALSAGARVPRPQLEESLVALFRHATDQSLDAAKRLYALNTLALAQARRAPTVELRAVMLRTIRELYDSHPFAYANPINFDFNDEGRLRHYRVATDIILLEALVIVSDQKLLFVETGAGRRIVARIVESLRPRPLEQDTTSHRPAITNVAYYHAVLSQLHVKAQASKPSRFLAFVQARVPNSARRWRRQVLSEFVCWWYLRYTFRWQHVVWLLGPVVLFGIVRLPSFLLETLWHGFLHH